MTYLRNAVYFFGILLAISLSGCGGGGSGGGTDTVNAAAAEGVWTGTAVGATTDCGGESTPIDEIFEVSITVDASGKIDLWMGESSINLTATSAGISATNAQDVVTINILGPGATELSNPNLTYSGTSMTGTLDVEFLEAPFTCIGTVDISATQAAPTQAPSAVVDAGQMDAGVDSISIGWDNEVTGGVPTGFIISRKLSSETTYVEIARVGTYASQYEDVGLELDTSYDYQIVAYNKAGEAAGFIIAEAFTGLMGP